MGLLNDPYDVYGYSDERRQFDNGGGAGDTPPPVIPPTSGYGTGITGAFVAPGAGGDHVGNGNGASGFDVAGRPLINLPGVPKFTPPQFHVPTFEEATNDPGYKFSVSEGERALQQSAAAKGLLRTGGTLKDLINYGQSAAGQQYGNVFNRALQSYETTYRGAHDAYAPLLVQYQTRAQAEMAAALAQYNRQWDVYLHDHPSGGGYHPSETPLTEDQFVSGGLH